MLREERATPCQRRHNNIIGQCLLAEIEPSVSIEFSTMCAFTAHVSYMGGGTDYRRKRCKYTRLSHMQIYAFPMLPCHTQMEFSVHYSEMFAKINENAIQTARFMHEKSYICHNF